MKLTPAEKQEQAVNLLSAAMTEPIDQNWLRTVIASLHQAKIANVEAAYREAAELAKLRDVTAPEYQELMKASSGA